MHIAVRIGTLIYANVRIGTLIYANVRIGTLIYAHSCKNWYSHICTSKNRSSNIRYVVVNLNMYM